LARWGDLEYLALAVTCHEEVPFHVGTHTINIDCSTIAGEIKEYCWLLLFECTGVRIDGEAVDSISYDCAGDVLGRRKIEELAAWGCLDTIGAMDICAGEQFNGKLGSSAAVAGPEIT
jgi:hypothetical protein